MIQVLSDDYWGSYDDGDYYYYDNYTYYWDCFDDSVDTYCGEAVPWELMTFEDTLTYSFSTSEGIKSVEAYCDMIKCLASYNIDTTADYTGEVCNWDYSLDVTYVDWYSLVDDTNGV